MYNSNVILTASICNSLQEYFAKNKNVSTVAVLVDENTYFHCYPLIKDVLPNHILVEVISGEENKNLDSCRHIWHELTRFALDRKSLLINLGGGVIGDMGGFCAAAFKRGISFINIPTTLLAMVDASIGGKLGIDFENYKNHIGFFRHPDAVLIDPVFLQTLDIRELRSGFAEVIKHSLIADKSYWPNVANHAFENQDWNAHISHSIEIKKAVVEADPTESGYRKILNFGHTIGHAIESHFLKIPGKKLLHGEAIAVGMICESWISNQLTGLDKKDLKQITDFILSVFGKVAISRENVESIITLCQQDKKSEKGKIRFSLLESLGRATFDINIKPDMISKSLEEYENL